MKTDPEFPEKQASSYRSEADMQRSLKLSLSLVAALLAATAGALYTMMPDRMGNDRITVENYR